MPDIATNSGAAVDWLTSWDRTGPWVVVEIDPEGQSSPSAHYPQTREALHAHIEQRNGRTNLYFVPNRVAPGATTTPTKQQITHVTSLYADLDLPKTGPHATPTDENFAWLLSRIEALDPPPSLIIFSGGGYQAFWLFPEPLPADKYLDRIEAAGRTIARNLKSDAVQNVNRLMRLPGTVNLPNATKRARGRTPTLARTVHADWSRHWSFETDPIPKLSEESAAYIEDGPTDTPRSSRRTVADLPDALRKAIRTGDAKDYGGDKSALVASIVSKLIRRGWDDDDIMPFIIEKRYGSSAHCLGQPNPMAYAKRQITQLREKITLSWEITPVTGRPVGTSPDNIRRALRELGYRLSYNEFASRTYVNGKGPLREWSDIIESRIIIEAYDQFKFRPDREVLRDVRNVVAADSTYHPVKDYLESLIWDGEPRIHEWLIKYARAEDCEYHREVSALTLIAAVRRIYHPGCKFDEMLVLINPKQGTGKSSTIKILAGNDDWFTDSLPMKLPEQKVIEQLSGRWLVECAELQGIHQSEVDALNAFLSREVDRSRLAYGHNPVNAPRQCIFIGTTNSEEFLRGNENRRYWPVRVYRVDTEGLAAARDQLWAEAFHYERTGMSIRLPEHLWSTAAVYQDKARYGEPWVDTLHKIFTANHVDEGKIMATDVWRMLGKPPYQRAHTDNGRLASAMAELGWEKKVRNFAKLGGQQPAAKCYVKGNHAYEISVTNDIMGEFEPKVFYPQIDENMDKLDAVKRIEEKIEAERTERRRQREQYGPSPAQQDTYYVDRDTPF